MYNTYPGPERLAVVKDCLAQRGYEVDTVAIEAAVYRMKNAGLFDLSLTSPETTIPVVEKEDAAQV